LVPRYSKTVVVVGVVFAGVGGVGVGVVVVVVGGGGGGDGGGSNTRTDRDVTCLSRTELILVFSPALVCLCSM
jgi:hypothetical protein